MNSRYMQRATLAFSLALFGASAVADPTLVSDAGASYDFNNETGSLSDGMAPGGNSDLCDTCFELYVDAELFDTTTGLAPPFDAGSTREAVYGPVTMSNGLDVTRKVYVPETGENFGRYLDYFSNPTASAVTFVYRNQGEWGSEGDGVVEATSSGDRMMTSVDRWWVSSDASIDNGGVPGDAVGVVLLFGNGGPLGAPRYVSLNDQDRDNDGGDTVAWEYEVTVPAGDDVAIMFFVGIVDTADEGASLAGTLDQLGDDGMLAELSAAEISAILNWGAADADDDGVSDYLESLGVTSLDADDDGDGLSTSEEFETGTDPLVADTDGDGLDDGTEVDLGTSPLLADSNGDGLSDLVDWGLGRALEGAGLAATVDGNQIVSGTSGVVSRVDVVVDTAGNYHYAFTGSINVGGLSLSDSEVWYGKINADGDELVEPTRVSTFDCTGTSTCRELRPRIGISPNMEYLYVAWQDNDTDEIVGVRLDADTGDILVSAKDIIFDRYHGSEIVVEDSGDFYFMTDSCSDIRLHAADSSLNELWTKSVNPGSVCHANADIAVDADGRLHMVFANSTDDINGTIIISYALVDPALYDALDTDAMVLIASTPISPDDNIRDNHANVLVDGDGLVYVVYGNGDATDAPSTSWGGGDTGEVYFTVLDPGADDQDGSASDDATLTVLADVMISEDDGVQSWYVNAGWGSDGNIHVVWADQDNPFYTSPGNGGTFQRNVYHMSVDTNGDVVSAATQLTDKGLGGRRNVHFMARGDRAFWVETQGKRVVATKALVEPAPAAPVTTASSTTPKNRMLTASVDSGSLVLFEAVELSGLTDDQVDSLPLSDYSYENGFYNAVINGIDAGATVNLTVTFPEAVDEESVMWMWNPVDEWHEIDVTVDGSSITLALTDGGSGDADGIANGVIVDPSGPGRSLAAEPAPPAPTPVNVSGGGGGGCVIGDGNRPLDPLFPALLALAAVYIIRRRVTN